MSGLPRLLRTVRHLKPSQVAWRLRYTLERKMPARAPAIPEAPALREPGAFPDVPVGHLPHGDPDAVFQRLDRGEIELVGKVLALGDPPDWLLGERGEDRLRAITLHYHEWAHALALVAAARGPERSRAIALLRERLASWIEQCPVTADGARALAWNSYAIATRLGWWIRAWRELETEPDAAWREWRPGLLRSAWQQAIWLERHLEWDLLGNHLLRDLVGLAWAGRFFAGDDADRWLRTAARLTPAQIDEQILSDGGHFERSPAYHLHVMGDVLALAVLVDDPALSERLRDVWAGMAEFAMWARFPDGTLPLLNDGGRRSAGDPGGLPALGARLGREVDGTIRRGGRHFEATGLVVWQGSPWTLFYDVGPIGPEFLTGHAHADTLTLECAYEGLHLFVDPGCFAYDNDDRRRYDRATVAHNTVAIEGLDSSEVWHIFRCGRRARPVGTSVTLGGGGLEAQAAHDGYERLSGAPRHQRRVVVADDGPLEVVDEVSGGGRHRLSGGMLLDPAWRVEPAGAGWLLERDGRRVRVRLEGPEGLARDVERRAYHPDYGQETTAPRLVWRFDGALPVRIRWLTEPA